MQTTISKTEHIGLIVLKDVLNDMVFISKVFEKLFARHVNIDMISQIPPHGDVTQLAFTFDDNHLGEVLEVVAELRKQHKTISSSVSSGNVKILISCEDMREQPGFACRVFQALAAVNTDIRLITTSEIDISVLVPQADANESLDALRAVFSAE